MLFWGVTYITCCYTLMLPLSEGSHLLFCVLYNVVSENHSVQNSPWGGGGGSIASSRPRICEKQIGHFLQNDARLDKNTMSLRSYKNEHVQLLTANVRMDWHYNYRSRLAGCLVSVLHTYQASI